MEKGVWLTLSFGPKPVKGPKLGGERFAPGLFGCPPVGRLRLPPNPRREALKALGKSRRSNYTESRTVFFPGIGLSKPLRPIALLLGLVLQFFLPNPLSAKALDRVVLQLRWTHQFQFAGYYAAKAKGYYEEEGLDVEILPAGPGAESPTSMVLSGLADFGVTNSGLILARMKGEPVVALAALFQTSPNAWLVLADSKIGSLHDLVGKNLMAMPLPESADLLAIFVHEGIPLSKLNLQKMSFDIEDLIQGRTDAFDAYSTNEPYFLAQRGIAYRMIRARNYGIDFYSDVLFTTEAQVRARPERVRGFRRASLRGWIYALNHSKEIAELIHRDYAPQKSLDHLEFEAEEMVKLIMPDLIEVGHMTQSRWEFIAKTDVALGLVPEVKNLQGFLYDPHYKPDYSWAYKTLAWTLALLVALVLAALWVFRLNLKLRKEVLERHKAEAHLKESETRQKYMIERAPFPLVLTQRSSGEILYVNKPARKFFVRDESHDPVGRTTLDYYADKDQQRLFAAELKRVGRVEGMEIKLLVPGGELVWAMVSASPMDFGAERQLLVGLTDITRAKALEEELRRRATTDDLTGCTNRPHFFELAQKEMERSRRFGRELSVLMLDVDHFKKINDLHGHEVGDRALKAFTKAVSQELRTMDLLGRIGGEEFSALLPETLLGGAGVVAERIRLAVEQTSLPLEGGNNLTFTVSIGVANLRPTDKEFSEPLGRADKALYQAKAQGRNRIAFLP